MRHKEIRDFTTSLLINVCIDVKVKPYLQPLDDETLHHATSSHDDNAQLDIATNGFWERRFEKSYFDVWVLNALALTNSQNLKSTFLKHEKIKKRTYSQ